MKARINIVDDQLPQTGFIFDGLDVTSGPVLTISEVAKFFFHRSAHWIRWAERKGFLRLDGKRVGVKRKKDGTKEGGARYYTLDDVEKMAHALTQNKIFDGEQLEDILRLLYAEGRVWGYLPVTQAGSNGTKLKKRSSRG
jgi:hypothetical protein